MIQLTEKELFELMTNLYNRKDNFNTLADAHEYINNEISKVKNLDLATVVNPLKDKERPTFDEWKNENCQEIEIDVFKYKYNYYNNENLKIIYNNKVKNGNL